MQLFYPFQRPFFEFIVRSRGNFHFSPRQTLLKPNKTEATRGFERKIKSCARWITRGIVTRFKNRPAKILESEKLRLLSFLSFFFSFLQEPLTGNKSGPDTERVSNYTRGQILGRVKPRLLSAARQTNFPCNDLAKQAQSVYMSSPASTLFEWRKRAEKRRNLIMITVRRGSEDLASDSIKIRSEIIGKFTLLSFVVFFSYKLKANVKWRLYMYMWIIK